MLLMNRTAELYELHVTKKEKQSLTSSHTGLTGICPRCHIAGDLSTAAQESSLRDTRILGNLEVAELYVKEGFVCIMLFLI